MINNKELFEQIKKENLPIGEYAIFGGGPLCVRGLRECGDLDVIVTSELFNKLKVEKNWILKTALSGSEALKNGNIEVFKDWPNFNNICKLIKDAEIIESLPFVRLVDVIFWKRIKGREKDLNDIEIIDKYFKDICEKQKK